MMVGVIRHYFHSYFSSIFDPTSLHILYLTYLHHVYLFMFFFLCLICQGHSATQYALCRLSITLQRILYNPNLMPWWKPYPSTRAYTRNRSITRVGSNSPDKVYTQSQSRSDTDVDVGLEEHSKQSKGESGTEVQSVTGAVEWEESEGGC